MSSNSEKDFWDWLQIGVDNEWITKPFCKMHDNGYEQMTEEEIVELEEGSDPCMTVTRLRFLG